MYDNPNVIRYCSYIKWIILVERRQQKIKLTKKWKQTKVTPVSVSPALLVLPEIFVGNFAACFTEVSPTLIMISYVP